MKEFFYQRVVFSEFMCGLCSLQRHRLIYPDKIALCFLYEKLVSKHAGVILPNTSYFMKLLRYMVIKANFNDAVSIILRQVDDKDFYDGERNVTGCDIIF